MTYTIHLINSYGNVDVHEDVQSNSLPRVIKLAHAIADTYSQRLEEGENAYLAIYNTATGERIWDEAIVKIF